MTDNIPEPGEDRICRRAEVERITGLTERWLRHLEARGEFPRRCKIGARLVGWSFSEVRAWCNARLESRDAA